MVRIGTVGKHLARSAAGIALFVTVLSGLAVSAAPAGAATLVVLNCNDSGPGSLRQAVADAASGDSISFALSSSCSTIHLTSGPITISQQLTIVGPGANNLAVSGDNASEVFDIATEGMANISGLTVEQGTASSGGGIYNQGVLTLSNSKVSGNTASNGWGAGFLTGTGSETDVVDSTFTGNVASVDGGGIFNYGTLTVSGSTFSGNHAVNGDGGGIYNFYQETAGVSDSTFSGNSAGFNGGGIVNEGGAMTVTSSTLSGNSAGTSGSDIAVGSMTTVQATILADGQMTTDCSGDITDNGYNLDDDNTCGFSSANHDLPATNPELENLANNGGLTETQLPALGSPVIGVIPTGTTSNDTQLCPRADQRGVESYGACSIGAVEGGFLITTTSLPDVEPGVTYGPLTLTTQETGMSTSPYKTAIQWTSVKVPKWLTLSSSGVLSGTPPGHLKVGIHSITVSVTETVKTLDGSARVKTKTTVETTLSLTVG